MYDPLSVGIVGQTFGIAELDVRDRQLVLEQRVEELNEDIASFFGSERSFESEVSHDVYETWFA